jgi:hypothetical protein
MAKGKKENEMVENVEVKPQEKAEDFGPAFQEKKVQQNLTVVDLATGEDQTLKYDYITVSLNEKLPPSVVLAEMSKLVSPELKQAKALANFYASEKNGESRKAVLNGGNYLTSALKSTLLDLMRQKADFADLKAADVIARWLTGYRAQKPGAIAMLENAKRILAIGEEELDF